ncbi:amidohydrolase [soil metagenome]
MLTSEQIEELRSIRHKLHTMPEVAGEEKKTAAFIKEKLQESGADKIMDGIGGNGLVATYEGKNPEKGITLMIRAELDALAIDEQNDIHYKSEKSNRMHACGHDGHMTIVLGVAEWLKENRPENGRVLLLFQPAEETGEGSGQMLKDAEFENLKIDRGIALHNLPGYKKNTIYIKTKTFALASVGVQISFRGKSSHAAHPEEGVNPSIAISKLILELERVKVKLAASDQFRVLTITYIKMGEPSFGMNPGYGEMGVTIRAETGDAIEDLYSELETNIKKVTDHFSGEIHYEKKEPFAATVNDKEGVDKLGKIADDLGMPIEILNDPIGWSEDFGEFRKKCPITLFGLGAGDDSPPLHSEIYDFNDDLIPTGVSIFCEWINKELNGK